jgi:two-component system NtrC family sensor kinase
MKETTETTTLFRSLGFRLAATVGAVLGLGLAGFLYFSMAHHEAALLAVKREEANLLSDTIKNSLSYSMEQGEEGRAAIHKVIAEIGQRAEIERIRIYDAVGRIQYSTSPEEMGTTVDKDAENCKLCHSGPEPLRSAGIKERSRFFYTPALPAESKHRVIGVINPIYNEKEKNCTACHLDQTVLGVLDVVVSLSNLEKDIVAHRHALAVSGILGVVVMIGVVALLIHHFVHHPVTSLLDGTRKVGLLNLEYRIPEQRGDELGRLAAAFNDMTERLARAQDEIRDFAEQLERKVARKTEELEQTQVQMLRSEKMVAIGQMAAGVAHEINNPLTGVITFAHLLKKSVPEEGRQREDLNTIIREAERCSRIVRGLLDFARGGEIVRRPLDVNEVLERTLSLMRYQPSFENVEIERQYAGDLPAIEADQDPVQQVFVNLIANAGEAMAGEGRLSLTTREVGDVNGHGPGVRVEVMDTGPGIAESDLGRIFDPFFSTKETGEGTGLGLSVTYRIVENHGGRIAVSSKVGAGTRFAVYLPARMDAAAGDRR